MTEPEKNPRIDGRHHYAVVVGRVHVTPRDVYMDDVAFYRKPDDRMVSRDHCDDIDAVTTILADLDDTAEFWIANTAAPYEQVRLMIGSMPILAGELLPPAMDFEKLRLAFLEVNSHTTFGECDSCGKRVPADDLNHIAYGEQGNSVADGSFCDDCAGV